MKPTWTRGEPWPKGFSDERPLRCTVCGESCALMFYLKFEHWFCGWCIEFHKGANDV